MTSFQLKQIESDLKRVIRGYIPEGLDKDYDIIQNNPYFLMKETFTVGDSEKRGIFHEMTKKLSHKMSVWLRESTDECIRSGRKVNIFLNY